MEATRRPPYLAFALLGALYAGMAYGSWGRWNDLFVDFGQQLYAAWRIAEGDVFHRDLLYLHGPLSVHLNGALMSLFGTGLWTLATAQLVLIAVLTALLWWLLARATDHRAATAGCAAFLILFAFARYLLAGNLNYVTPYTYEATHGLFLALVAVAALGRWATRRRRHWLWLAGLAAGGVLLTKAEVAFATGLAVVLWLAVLGIRERRAAWRPVIELCVATTLPPLVAWIYLSWQTSPGMALEALIAPYLYALDPRMRELPLYRLVGGFVDPARQLARIALGSLVWAAVGGALVVIAFVTGRLAPAARRNVSWLVTATVLLVVALGQTSIPWRGQAARPLPVLLVVLLVLALVVSLRNRSGPLDERETLRLAGCALALGLLVKLALNTRIDHFGFTLAMPAALIAIATAVAVIPSWVERRGAEPWVVRGAALAILVGALVACLVPQARVWGRLDTPIGLVEADRYLADDPRAAHVQAAIEAMATRIAPDETVIVVPDAIMLQYLARRRSPVRHINYVPTEMVLWGEETMLAALVETPPDWVVVIDVQPGVSDAGRFGRDFGQDLAGWIREHYQPAWLTGAPPYSGRGFGILLLARKAD